MEQYTLYPFFLSLYIATFMHIKSAHIHRSVPNFSMISQFFLPFDNHCGPIRQVNRVHLGLAYVVHRMFTITYERACKWNYMSKNLKLYISVYGICQHYYTKQIVFYWSHILSKSICFLSLGPKNVFVSVFFFLIKQKKINNNTLIQ